MISFAEDIYLTQIKDLWENAFGDSEEDIDFYFTNRHKNEYMLIYLDGDKLAAMLSMLPISLKSDGKSYTGRYMYALATEASYQGKGIMTELLESAYSIMRGNNEIAAVLVPAGNNLFNYYGKRGYEKLFKIDKEKILSAEINMDQSNSICSPCNVEDFYRIRGKVFGTGGLFIEWDILALEYELMAAKKRNTPVCHIKTDSGEGYAVYELNNNIAHVKELALISISLQEALSVLDKEINAEEYHLRLKAGTGGPRALTEDFGMINWLVKNHEKKEKTSYLGLVLD